MNKYFVHSTLILVLLASYFSTKALAVDSDLGFINPGPIEVSIPKDECRFAYYLKSTWGTTISPQGYPTTYGAGIYNTFSATSSGPGMIISVFICVDSSVQAGDYSGIQTYTSKAVTGEMTFPVLVHVTPAAAITFRYVQAAGITKNTANISWDTNRGGTSQVIYGTSPNKLTSKTAVDSQLVVIHSVNLTNLSKNKVYYYKVVSKNLDGVEYQSEVFSFKTLAH